MLPALDSSLSPSTPLPALGSKYVELFQRLGLFCLAARLPHRCSQSTTFGFSPLAARPDNESLNARARESFHTTDDTKYQGSPETEDYFLKPDLTLPSLSKYCGHGEKILQLATKVTLHPVRAGMSTPPPSSRC